MTHVPAWRSFKRMQISASVFACLIYAAAALYGWRELPGPQGLKTAVVLIFPAIYALLALVVPLQVPPARRLLKRYVWLSFAAGFGQTVVSVLICLGLIALAATFIYLQVAAAVDGGRYPAGVFSAYGAGIGILLAQTLLVYALEREPKIREIIETREP